jgi:hypothetical protein
VARRRRAVERATSRQLITDRIVIGVLVVVAASGLMSVVPANAQVGLSRIACQVASLGLGSCGEARLNLENTQLAPARCSTLASLDAVLPEVRVERIVTPQGLPVTISQARSGDVVVGLGDATASPPPELLWGEARGERELLPGARVPSAAEWLLPRGQGLDALVSATYDSHQRWVERRSALALIGSITAGAAPQIPPPTLSSSRVRLDQQLLPRFPDEPGGPRTHSTPESRGPRAPSDELSVDRTEPGTLVVNAISGDSSLVASLAGTVGGRPATGTVRLTRDANGVITHILLGVVSDHQLVPGRPRVSLSGPEVAFISIPARTDPERELVSAWVADPGGLRIGLDELLGLRTPRPNDRLGAFLTRASSVTVLRYGLVRSADLQARVSAELTTLRREDWTGIRMIAAGSVAPQPSGGRRVLVDDPSCRT